MITGTRLQINKLAGRINELEKRVEKLEQGGTKKKKKAKAFDPQLELGKG